MRIHELRPSGWLLMMLLPMLVAAWPEHSWADA